jgi:hypothetical protein
LQITTIISRVAIEYGTIPILDDEFDPINEKLLAI